MSTSVHIAPSGDSGEAKARDGSALAAASDTASKGEAEGTTVNAMAAVAPAAGIVAPNLGDQLTGDSGTVHTKQQIATHVAYAELLEEMAAEAIGTFFIVIFGVGSVVSAVAVVWGFGVSLAIYCTADVSGAHLNPAVSLALAMFRRKDFPVRKLGWYWLAQLVGAVLGGLINLWSYGAVIRDHEDTTTFKRGDAGSERTAMIFGEYYPNPGTSIPDDSVSTAHALFIEAWGTCVLMFIILAVTDKNNSILGPHKQLAPFFIGFTVACLISVYAPLTQAGWNPARDFGPRLVAVMAGFGDVAIPGPRNGFWVYIVGPLLGAPVGALLYDYTLKRGFERKAQRRAAQRRAAQQQQQQQQQQQ